MDEPAARVNPEMVDLEELTDAGRRRRAARRSSRRTPRATGSQRAAAHPGTTGTCERGRFFKVMPRDYRRALAELAAEAAAAAADAGRALRRGGAAAGARGGRAAGAAVAA